MAYVPFQPNGADSYTAVRGFEAGTMFPALDKPWYGEKCRGVKR
ncbi:MAG: spore coat associated protein CotJA [Ruminococcus sp.]|nr:spore coat associated protein CotJA [Ruminococcus sp.]